MKINAPRPRIRMSTSWTSSARQKGDHIHSRTYPPFQCLYFCVSKTLVKNFARRTLDNVLDDVSCTKRLFNVGRYTTTTLTPPWIKFKILTPSYMDITIILGIEMMWVKSCCQNLYGQFFIPHSAYVCVLKLCYL